MQRKIRDIYATIQHSPARTAWEKGVRACADDLFSDYIEKALGILDIEVRIGKITEADLLRGAPNWDRYSRGGMALVSNSWNRWGPSFRWTYWMFKPMP